MFFNKSDDTKDKVIDKVLSNDSFTNLNIDLIDLDLKIETGDKFEVHYKGLSDEEPSVELTNDTIEIKEPKIDHKDSKLWKKGIFEVNIVSYNDGGNLIITVPEDIHLSAGRVSTISGDTDIKNLKLDSLSLFVVSGDVSLKETQVDEVKLTATSGDIDFKRVKVKQGKVKLTSGDFTMKNGEVSGKLQVSTSSGDNIVENVKAQQYQLSTLSGDNSLFGKNGTVAKVNSTNNDGTIILSTLSGDNTVK